MLINCERVTPSAEQLLFTTVCIHSKDTVHIFYLNQRKLCMQINGRLLTLQTGSKPLNFINPKMSSSRFYTKMQEKLVYSVYK